MAKIDRFVEMMVQRQVQRAVLSGGQPSQLFIAGRKSEGSMLSVEQVQQALEEVLPPHLQPQMQAGGAFHFVYPSPVGNFDIGAETFLGTIQIIITPSSREATAPAAPMAGPAPEPAALWQTNTPAVVTAPVPASFPMVQPGTLGVLSCVLHPDRPAAGTCSYSGKFYCSEDLVEVDGKIYGKENLGRVMGEARAGTGMNNPMVFMNAGGASAVSNPITTVNSAPAYAPPPYSPPLVIRRRRKRTDAIILCCAGLTGVCGLHRFYTRDYLIGVLQLFTVGGFGV